MTRRRGMAADGVAAKNWELPFPTTESCRVQGLQLDYVWTFRDHMTEARRKLRVRQTVLNKASNAKWGLGNRILTTTAHALIESPLNHGPTVTGSAATENDLQQVITCILNPTAWRIAGVGPAIRGDVLYTLAGPRSIQNHGLPRVANAMDRALRASATQVRKNMAKYLSLKEHDAGTSRSTGE